MKATGRSVWQNSEGKWLYQVYIPQPPLKPIKKIRHTSTEAEAERLVEALYIELKKASLNIRPQLFNELVANYLKLKAPFVCESTLANNKYLAEKFLLPNFGHRVASKITSVEVQFFLDNLRPALSTATVHKLQSIFNQIFRIAVDHKFLAENPIERMPRLRSLKNEKTQVEEPWSPDEARCSLLAVQGTVIDFAIHATISYGLRKGEALGIQWGDIDFENGWLDVKRSRSSHRVIGADGKIHTSNESGPLKTKASRRRLHLNSLVLLSLMREKEFQIARGLAVTESDYVSSGVNGQPLSEATLYRTYNRLCEGSNLRRIRIHDHRHTAAVLALEAMVEPIVVSYGLGHSSFEITKRIYASVAPGLTQKFSVAVSDVLLGEPDATRPLAKVGRGL